LNATPSKKSPSKEKGIKRPPVFRGKGLKTPEKGKRNVVCLGSRCDPVAEGVKKKQSENFQETRRLSTQEMITYRSFGVG